MRFLKDMIARRADARAAVYPEAEELEALDDDGWLEDQEDWDWSEADEDGFVDDEELEMEAEEEEDVPVEEFETLLAEAEPEPSPADPEAEDAEDGDQDEVALKIWELFDEDADEAPVQDATAEETDASSTDLAKQALKSMVGPVPPVERTPVDAVRAHFPGAEAEDQPTPRAGRAKTRMLGFHNPENAMPKVFDHAETKDRSADGRFPVGWLVLVEGPGRGTFFPLYCGVSTIGRGANQKIKLDFGDTSISRDSHALIAYDEDANAFFVGHTGKANLIRLNGRPVLSTEEVANFDLIRIGETTLRFVGFCGPEFAWDMTEDEEIAHVRAG